MKRKIAVSLDEESIAFLDRQSPNRSEYLNYLLQENRRQVLQAQIIAALQEDQADPEFQADIADWNAVIGDGVNAEG